MIYRGPGFLTVLPHPPFRQQPRPETHRKTEKERQVVPDNGGGGQGAKSYDRIKAWPSMNHSIRFGLGSPAYINSDLFFLFDLNRREEGAEFSSVHSRRIPRRLQHSPSQETKIFATKYGLAELNSTV